MSDATYRIEILFDPHSRTLPWDARIHRLSDDLYVSMVSADTYDSAVGLAREWVAAETRHAAQGTTLYVDDDGNPAEPHSVKVS